MQDVKGQSFTPLAIHEVQQDEEALACCAATGSDTLQTGGGELIPETTLSKEAGVGSLKDGEVHEMQYLH